MSCTVEVLFILLSFFSASLSFARTNLIWLCTTLFSIISLLSKSLKTKQDKLYLC